MIVSAFTVAALCGVAVLVALAGGYHLVRAFEGREQLVTRAEDLGADPAVLSDPLRRRSFLVRWADRYDRSPAAAALRERLRRAYVPWKPSDYRVIRLSLGFGSLAVFWLLLELPLLPSILLALAAYYVVPRLFFFIRRDAYVNAFNAQLVEITQLLANALRAGMSIQQAITQVVDRLPDPAQGEFRQTRHELVLGDSLATALGGLRKRVHSRDLDVVVSAIVVQHQAGGNLARVLAEMSAVLTERQRLSSEIRSMTAEARFSAMIVQLMPIALLIMLRNTPLGEALFSSMIGWMLLAIFVAVQVGVYFLIQRIVKIDV